MTKYARILAIDPGFDRMGIAVVEGDPSRPTLLWSGCVTPPKGEASSRLATLGEAVHDALERFTPDALGLEALFFSTNVKTAIGVSEARGVILAAAGGHACRVIECSPQEVKLAVTGYGAADKRAVALMLPKLVALASGEDVSQYLAHRLDDELDAIAVGIAALAKAKQLV